MKRKSFSLLDVIVTNARHKSERAKRRSRRTPIRTIESLEVRQVLAGDVLVKVSDDPNANGISDPGEDRLAGWTVFLDLNANTTLDAGEPAALSDARGEVLFSGLAAGNYTVREIVEPHWVPTSPVSTNARVRDGKQENITFFNFHPQIGTISGTAWNDLDGDGIRSLDPATGSYTEPAIAGLPIFVDLNHDGAATPGEPSTLTDANGHYAFGPLASGGYAVVEVLPSGWEATTGYNVVKSVTVRTDLDTVADFGNFETRPVTVRGDVWNDLDGNGIRAVDVATGGFTEPGLADRPVFVDVNGDGLLSAGEPSALSDASGHYTITGASHGSFFVREVARPDWIPTAPASAARLVELRNGQTHGGIDFGSTIVRPGTIAGTVWNDHDGNGIRAVDSISGAFTEPGVAGWRVYVDSNNDGLLSAGEPSAVSDVEGHYTISGVARGSVTVREVVQADWLATAPSTATQSFTLGNGETRANVDFGNKQRQESTISGTTYFDTNHNGVRDALERGLSGITVYLDINDNGAVDAGEPQSTSSTDLFFTPAIDETGSYSFTHLAAGNYRVREIVPTVLSATPDAQRWHDVALLTTESHGGIDFGNIFRPNEIHGVDFDDLDGDHLRGPLEPTIPGSTVYIDTNRDNLWEPGEPTTVTGDDGSYVFTDLIPGTYVVRRRHGSDRDHTYPATVGGILWPDGVSNPASGIVSPLGITTSLAEGESHRETVSLTLPGSGGLTNLVDVFLLFDDTGSFTANSPIVRAAFPQIISTLQASLPDVDFGFGVGRFEEYGNFASEFSSGRPFILNQPIVAAGTPGFATAIQAALDRVAPGYGGDQPETLIEALYQTVTGLGFDGNNNGTVSDSGAAGMVATQVAPGASGDVPAFASFTADPSGAMLPAAGNLGGAGFRPGALPIILAATDTGFAYQPKGETSIVGANGLTLPLSMLTQASRSTTPFGAGAGIQETITGLNALGALVVGMGTNAVATADPRQDLESIAKLTGAINQSTTTIANGTADPIAPGDPLYFQINSGFGNTVANGVVNAIQNGVTNVAMNITLRSSDPRVQIINHTGTITNVGAGQTATFDVEFVGDGRPHRFDLQFIREGTSVVLGSIPVVIGTPIPGDGYQYEDLDDGEIEDHADFGSRSHSLVTPNVAPSFLAGGDLEITEDAAATSFANWATQILAGPPAESGQALHFTVETNNASLFSVAPSLSSDGTLSFTLAANANGSAAMTIVLHDDGGIANGGSDSSAPMTATIHVLAVNDAPMVTDDSLVATQDAPLTITAGDLTGNDLDVDGDVLSVIVGDAPAHGTLRPNADGTWTYLPDATYLGPDRFTYQATDGVANSGLGIVDVLVMPAIALPPTSVVSRKIVYNNSYFDSHTAAAGDPDDNAIAMDKTALLPGGTATFSNYTSYSRGINAIVIDLAAAAHVPTLADFSFKIGNDNNPSGWFAAPTPQTLIVRPGAGVGGSDRLEFIWPDGAIKNTWLQTTVSTTLGLAAPDVFYFGNAIAEGGGSDNAVVNSADELQARNHPRSFDNPAPIDFAYDYNRDGFVNAIDQIVARANRTTLGTSLQLITVPAAVGGTATTISHSAPPSPLVADSAAAAERVDAALAMAMGLTSDALRRAESARHALGTSLQLPGLVTAQGSDKHGVSPAQTIDIALHLIDEDLVDLLARSKHLRRHASFPSSITIR